MRTLKWGAVFMLGVLVGSCVNITVVRPCQASVLTLKPVEQPAPPRAIAPYGDVQDAEVKINYTEGHCTGVLLARTPGATESRYIASAAHCFDESGKYDPLTGINGVPMTGEIIAGDGKDHVVVRLSQSVKGKPVWFGDFPAPGAQVFTWGNPGDLEHQLRIGYVSGVWLQDGTLYNVMDLPNWHGDSGGPIFDMQGRVVALHYGYHFNTNYENGQTYRATIAEPFAFTPQQLRGIQ